MIARLRLGASSLIRIVRKTGSFICRIKGYGCTVAPIFAFTRFSIEVAELVSRMEFS